MSVRFSALASAVVFTGVLGVTTPWAPWALDVEAQGRRPVGPTGAWSGRTAWGDPDLQGKWELVEVATPMERPKEQANRETLTDAEVAARIEAFKKSAPPSDPDLDIAYPEVKASAPEHEKGIRGQEYNRFWADSQRRIHPWNRTSLVIEPPDGRIPPFTPEAIKRIEDREAARSSRGESDTWEDRNLGERCLSDTFFRFVAGGPAGDLSVRHIVQTPGWVAFMVSTLNSNDPIIVPLDGRSRPSDGVRRWYGVPRGRWDGATLVVETTHVNGKQDGGPVMPSRTPYIKYLGAGDAVRLTERFRRVDANTIEYRYTIDDPKTYVRPYTVLRPLLKLGDDLLMPENACHEGNYGIVGQLSGGRADEAYALRAAKAEAEGRGPLLQEMKRRTDEWVRSNPPKR